tara:strand:+ start:2696 stop:2992 length:297 start_codon:yes stop_codon:yes gene_type:complete
MKVSERSNAYVMTAYTASASDMLEIENIRNAVKVINKGNKQAEKRRIYGGASFPRYRVSIKGRYGRNNPNYNRHLAKIGSVPIEHAERVDVYIHRRYR